MGEERVRLKLSNYYLAVVLTLLISILDPATARAEHQPEKNVLILNSYHKGFDWTDEQNDGMEEILKSADATTTIHTEYMDWKRYPSNNNLVNFYNLIKSKYQNVHIDVIYATDNGALEFAMRYRKELLGDAPIIFSGVNQVELDRFRDRTNLAGVLEEVDPVATLEMAKQINPVLRNVYVIFDNSASGFSNGKMVIDKILHQDLGLQLYPMNRLTKEEIMAKAAALPSDSIILMTTYFSDSTGRIVEFAPFASELSKSSAVPVYHIYDFSLNQGAFGGSMISGKIQGQKAAELVIRVLHGDTPNSIPIAAHNTVRKVFDYNELQRFQVSLKELPEGSEVINKPFSFYETYKSLVLSILGAFVILITFIGILLFYVRLVKRMRRKLEMSNERFGLAAYGSDAVIWDVDMSTMIYYFSDSWYELLGYEKDEIGEARGGWRSILHPEDIDQENKERIKHLEGRTAYYYCEYRMRAKSGEYKWFQARGKVLRSPSGEYVRFAGSMIDITDRKEYQSQLQMSYQELESTYEELAALQDELMEQYNRVVENQELLQNSEEKYRLLAYNDVLSGLPNRLSLSEELRTFIVEHAGSHAAVFFLDIDNFKYINDTMGHTFGDELLVQVGERLVGLSDQRSKHFRFGGDEFVILLENIEGPNEAIAYAEAIVQGFKEPFQLNASVVHISTSIGIAAYPENGSNAEELLKNADIAMYKAKEAGKGTYVMYGESMQQHFDERMIIEKHLRNVIENEELSLHYQPIIDLGRGGVWGFEALIRWNSPVLGFVSPLSFIKIAEDCRLIVPIGEWVLRTACQFMKDLHDKGHKRKLISVNISVVQLMMEDFAEVVLSVLEDTGLPPRYLQLEITESIFMESFEEISKKLELLRDKGIRVALDDFGTGYSSLSYLKQLPITTLKIDKSFIDRLDAPDNMSLTSSIVAIGHNMGLRVTAEGVETAEQLAFLEQNQCDKIQGYYISRPLPESEVEGWITNWPAVDLKL
jgi:diguanylate cyclase (GGDEF)-like protein/PAS domain S-box-containing protein